MASLKKWNSTEFVDTVSRKIGSAPAHASEGRWGDVHAVRWFHPSHETATAALEQHFFALTLSEFTKIDCKVNGGKTVKTNMRAGAATFIPAGRSAAWVIHNPMNVLNIFLPGDLLKSICEQNTQHYQNILSGKELMGVDDPHIQRLSAIIRDELESGCAGGRLYIDSVMIALCSRIIAIQSQHGDALLADRRVTLTSQSVKRVIDYMQEHLDHDIALKDISSVASLSDFHFARCFKQSVGVSPVKYLNQLRVKKAQDLLSQTSLPLMQIAVAVGLGTQSQFTHVFKRFTGSTPAEFRRANAKEAV